MIIVNLPALELREQTPGDASLHEHAAAPMLDAFYLSRFVE